MKTIFYPERKDWATLCARPEVDAESLDEVCAGVFREVRENGDEALRKYTRQFDRADIDRFEVREEEFAEAQRAVPQDLKDAIRVAKANIEAFHRLQSPQAVRWDSPDGFVCQQRAVPIGRVGIYVPGGSAPLFSTVLMLAVPARIAGCGQVVMCTPPSPDGRVNPAVLWAARLCGVDKVFKVGGIQAIAAMTFGTQTVPKVYKLFGPGNRYVMAAKQYALNRGVAIDMPAGPSEVLVVADRSARADFVAADLLSQAEHGPDSQVVLLTDQADFPQAVAAEIEKQLACLPRRGMAEKALENSRMIVMEDLDRCMDFSNEYAPEHLILCTEDCAERAGRVTDAGSVFLGNYSPESAGDYASGTNHTLPTSAYARSYSGVNVDAFVKKITFQQISPQGLAALGPVIETMAGAEELSAHKNAVTIRLKTLEK